ncbi:hypothetical protein EYF80_032833 [Liparis tanakae]|uniref:Uncharacterized protein n=1 Tax=Liparis tanakae TaxID=230148 RepID=A0A4Z2GV08_9TELE|nr:hypothetical protein EYF80_032833 [Liparis tanakae]
MPINEYYPSAQCDPKARIPHLSGLDLTAGPTRSHFTLRAADSSTTPIPRHLTALQTTGGAEKMRRGLLLVTLFLVMKLRHSQSRCEEPGSRRATSDFQKTTGLDSLKRNSLKRFSDLDYDSFVGLMGRRAAGEMHDIFVGLMGRRNSEPDNGPSRREYPERRGMFLNKCRLRFLQGL